MKKAYPLLLGRPDAHSGSDHQPATAEQLVPVSRLTDYHARAFDIEERFYNSGYIQSTMTWPRVSARGGLLQDHIPYRQTCDHEWRRSLIPPEPIGLVRTSPLPRPEACPCILFVAESRFL